MVSMRFLKRVFLLQVLHRWIRPQRLLKWGFLRARSAHRADRADTPQHVVDLILLNTDLANELCRSVRSSVKEIKSRASNCPKCRKSLQRTSEKCMFMQFQCVSIGLSVDQKLLRTQPMKWLARTHPKVNIINVKNSGVYDHNSNL